MFQIQEEIKMNDEKYPDFLNEISNYLLRIANYSKLYVDNIITTIMQFLTFMNTYKWGQMDVNHFAWGFMSTPTCNRETVVNAWKDTFGIDVVIPDDSFWIDEYVKEETDETDSYNNE